MAPIGSAHGGTVVGLTELVARAVADGRALLSVQGPLRPDRRNEPQPNLMLLRPRADRYRSDHPTGTRRRRASGLRHSLRLRRIPHLR
jgi:hypothetical protein